MSPTSEHLQTAPEHLTVGAEEVTIRVDSAASDGELLALEVRMPPGGGPPGLHRHDPFELYLVQSGQLTFYLADDAGEVHPKTAGPGDLVPIASGREHTVRNESSADAQALAIFTPGREIERFSRAAAALNSRDLETMVSLAARHGIDMTRALEGPR